MNKCSQNSLLFYLHSDNSHGILSYQKLNVCDRVILFYSKLWEILREIKVIYDICVMRGLIDSVVWNLVYQADEQAV